MRYLVNSGQMKRADQYTIQELGKPSLELMERAAEACVEAMEQERIDLSDVCVVCGSGNNGGDGFAVARLLARKGWPVTVCFVGNASGCTEETKVQMRRIRETGIEICNEYKPGEYSVIIDAIFGVGLGREIIGKYLQVIRQMNEARAFKFAIDIPSGISADHGSVMGIAFKADLTVTFQLQKLGIALYPGRTYAGKVIVKDIGISDKGLCAEKRLVYTNDTEDYQKLLPRRDADSNKGSYGKLLVIAGSKGMSGAAYLNAKAAYMSGAGLVQIYTAEDNRVILQQMLPEAIIKTYDIYDQGELIRLLKWADTVCIGSGLGTSEKARKILRTTLENLSVPCLIDADGLNLIAAHKKYMDPFLETDLVITPHMMEMSRLTGLGIREIKARRMDILEEFVETYQLTCILKDARTVVGTPGVGMYINMSGNAAMAKAGSGDVLAGIVSGLMAQGLPGKDAAVLGTYLHGRAGDYACNAKGRYSVMATDLIECLSKAFQEQGA